MKWRHALLGDICLRLSSGKNITASKIHDVGAYPVLGANGLRGFIDEANFWGKCNVIGRQGMACGNVRYFDGSAYMTDHALVAVYDDSVDTRYMAYYLARENLGKLSAQAAQPGVSVTVLSKYPLALPPLPIQQKIADVLGSYDDLIENNRRRIELLEKMARELYRERFVRRRGNRSVRAINDVCAVQYGYAFNSKMFNTSREGLPIVRIRNIPLGSSSDYTAERASDSYIVHNGEILVGMDGEFHINIWSGGDAYLVQRCCCFRPFDENIKGYLIEAIREPIKYFESSAMGATVGHLGKKDIDTIEIAEPTSEEILLFQSMYDERLKLALQNRNLAKQRDRLLPRLMSGRLDVSRLVKEGV